MTGTLPAQLVITDGSGAKSTGAVALSKRVFTVGTTAEHDARVGARLEGLLFTVFREGAGAECLPASKKVRVNGIPASGPVRLTSCDRIEWPGGAAVFLDQGTATVGAAPRTDQPVAVAERALGVLQEIFSNLGTELGTELGANASRLDVAIGQALEALVEMAGAEQGYLLSDLDGRAWRLLAARYARDAERPAAHEITPDLRPDLKTLISSTIVNEAVRLRAPVHVENVIGHPWAEAASVIGARIFSAACFPLCLGGHVFGAVFLCTRSPGHVIRKDTLPDLGALATLAALIASLQTRLRSVSGENAELRRRVGRETSGDVPALVAADAFPRSPAMAEVERKARRLAPTALSVLILGETGTGKELLARAIHAASDRRDGPFVAINCAAIPAPLLESTLFGHERGAFTGATHAHEGKFAQADGGTLFLDEIGELPLELQAKLLRALQEREIEPLGSTRRRRIDVRILAATLQDPETAIRAGRFRSDLYFRLCGASLKLPPLRERREEIAPLARQFLRKAGSRLELTPAAISALEAHAWPGNVRELDQVVQRAAWLADGPVILAEDLELRAAPASAPASAVWASLEQAQLSFTREYVERALAQKAGNRAEAADALGISERTLYRILSKCTSDTTA